MLVFMFTIGCMVSNAQTFTLNPNQDHSITYDVAHTMTHKFRTEYPSLNTGNWFGKTALLSVLNQEGCVGIRFYNAIDEYGILKLVGVGVKTDNTEMTGGVIIERSVCCTLVRCFPCGTAFD